MTVERTHQPRCRGYRQLTRDERLKILTLRKYLNLPQTRIAEQLGVSMNQVRYTCHHGQVTPKHYRAGRAKKLSESEVDEIVDWIQASPDNRAKSYDEIVRELDLFVCGETLRVALKERGVSTYHGAKPVASRQQVPPNTSRIGDGSLV